jgi:hypothetical protein
MLTGPVVAVAAGALGAVGSAAGLGAAAEEGVAEDSAPPRPDKGAE